MSGIFAISSPTHRRRSSTPSKAPLLPVANPPGKGQCDVLMTGSLWKRRGWHRGSQKAKRFCVLVGPKNPSLRYYIQEKDFKAGLAFRKAYDLEGCSLSCPGRSSGNATQLVIVHPERGQIFFDCPSPEQCEWWMQALEGTLLDRQVVGMSDFEPLHLVGKGSFGMVLQVRKKETGAIYALKILDKKNVLKEEMTMKQTMFERKVLEMVNHPFVVKLQFAYQTKGCLCLVMDFVNGGELFSHLAKAGTFSEDNTRLWSAEILLALEYLHEMDIIYSDLKPENILMDPEGHVKLTDFGLARQGTSQGELDIVAGSAYYVAPEVLLMKGHTFTADWWSLGILIHEMLTGLPPFYSHEGDTGGAYKKLLSQEIEYPEGSGISTNARELIKGLVQASPSERLRIHSSESVGDQAQGGSGCLKSQPWWQLDWNQVIRRQYSPTSLSFDKPKDLFDVSLFDKRFTDDLSWKESAVFFEEGPEKAERAETCVTEILGLSGGPQDTLEAFGPDFDFVKAPVFQRRRNQSYDTLSIRSFEGSSSSLDDVRSPTAGTDSDTGPSPHQTGSSSFHGESRNISENFLSEIKEEEDRASTLDAPPWAMMREYYPSVDDFHRRAVMSSDPQELCPRFRQGSLLKRGKKYSKKWRKRLVKLLPSLGCCMYFQDESSLVPKGVIPLSFMDSITQNEGMHLSEGKVYEYSFSINMGLGGEREFEFLCESEQERDEWIMDLRITANRWSRSPYKGVQLVDMLHRKKRNVTSWLMASFSQGPSTPSGSTVWMGVLQNGQTVQMIGEIFQEQGAPDGEMSRYDGIVDKDGLFHERGSLVSWDGRVYSGFWQHGAEGSSALVRYADGAFYEGAWRTGEPCLHDFAHLSGGGALEGLLATISVDENVENVKGIVKRGGKWVRGRRHGHGILHSAEGSVYEGRWRNDQEHGVGIKSDAFERSVLVGEFVQGLPSGHGVKYYSDGSVYDGQFLEGNKVGVGVVMQPMSMQSAPTLSHAASSNNVLLSRASSEGGSGRSLRIEERVEPPGAECKSPPSPSSPGAGAGAGALDDSLSQPSSTGSRGKPPLDQWKANRIKGMMSQMSSFRCIDGVLLHTSVEETYEQKCKQKSGSHESLVGGQESQDTSCAEEMAKGEELKRVPGGVSGEVGGDWGQGHVPTAIKRKGCREWEDSATDEDEDGEDEDEGGEQEERDEERDEERGKNKAQDPAAAHQPSCEN